MRRSQWLIAGVLVAAASITVLVAPPAAAVDVSGCSGSATSYDADGAKLQEVVAPGPGATKADPFRIDPNGSVRWTGQTDAVIRDGSWTVDAWPFSVSGKIGNGEGLVTKSGDDKVKDRMPFEAPGLYYVHVQLTGSDAARCEVSGWVRVTGSPAFTPLWFGAAALMAGGGAGWLSLLLRGRRAGRVLAAVS